MDDGNKSDTQSTEVMTGLKVGEDLYKIIIECSNDGVAVLEDHTHVYVNHRFLEIFAYESTDELIGKPAVETVHPEDRAMFTEVISRRMAGEPLPHHIRFRAVRKDGSVIYVESSGTPCTMDGKQLFIALYRDITDRQEAEEKIRRLNEELEYRVAERTAELESANRQLSEEISRRKQVEEQLRESEARYKNIFENAVEGLFHGTPDGTDHMVNQAQAKIYGYASPEEMVSTITDFGKQMFVNPADCEMLLEHLATDGVVTGFVAERLRKDGTTVWVRSHVRANRDGSGKILYVEGANEDISSLRKAELDLEEERRRFQALIEHSPMGMSVYDKDGIILYVNPRHESLFGYTKEDMPDLATWWEKTAVDPLERASALDRFRAGWDRLHPGERSDFMVRPVRCKNGEEKIVEFVSYRVDSERTVGYCMDVTDQRRMEAQLVGQRDLAVAMSGATSVAETLPSILERLVLATDMDAGGIYLADEEQGAFRLACARGVSSLFQKRVRRIRVDPACPGPLGQVLPTYTAFEGVRTYTGEVDPADRPKVVAVIPFAQEGLITGILVVASRGSDIIPPDRRVTLETAAAQIAATISRIRTREGLEQSEAKYRGIFENAMEGIFQATPNGRILSANPAFAAMFGYDSPHEIVENEDIMASRVTLDPLGWKRLVKQINREGAVGSFAMKGRRKDGKQLWSSIYARAVKDRRGRLLYLEGVIQDVTDLKEAEERLREEKERFQILTEHAPLGMALLNEKRQRVYVNPKFTELFGYALEEVRSYASWAERTGLYQDSLKGLTSLWYEDQRKFRSGETVEPFVRPVTCKDRSVKLIRFTPVRIDAKRTLICYEDVSERRMMEQQLSAQRDLALALAAASSFEEVMPAAISGAIDAAGMDGGGLYIYDEALEGYKLVCSAGFPDRLLEVLKLIKRNLSIPGSIDAEKPVFIGPSDMEVYIGHSLRKERIKAVAVLPLLHRGRSVGSLVAFSRTLTGISHRQRGLLEAIAAEIAGVILRVRMREALAASEEKFRMLSEKSLVGVFILQDTRFRYVNPILAETFGYTPDEIIDRMGPEDAVIPDDFPSAQEYVRRLMSGEDKLGPAGLKIRAKTREGRLVYLRALGTRIVYQGRPALIGTILDVTEQKLAEDALRQKLDDLGLLYEISGTLLQQSVPENIYDDLCRLAVERLGLKMAWVGLIEDPVRSGIRAVAQQGMKRGYRRFLKMVCAEAARGGGTVGTAITAGAPSAMHNIEDSTGDHWRESVLRHGYRSAASFPLIFGSEVFGVFTTYSGIPDYFIPDRLVTLQSFANLAANVIANVRLLGEVSLERDRVRAMASRLKEVEEAERQQVSRELHDQIGQNLTALGINLNIIRTRSGEDPAFAARLADCIALLKEMTNSIRNLTGQLRPVLLDDYGLVPALKSYCTQFQARFGIKVIIESEKAEMRYSPSVETALFRIAQEALHNVAKHAKAKSVVVTVYSSDWSLVMTIADDGVGFESKAKNGEGQKGWGLTIMAERAEAAGGTCRVDSKPGKGTKVIVEVTDAH